MLLAFGLAVAWLGSLAGLVGLNLSHWADRPVLVLSLVLAAILVRTLLQTGLFIVAHDAMHGLLFPGNPRLNRLLGQVFLALYGGLSFLACKRNHLRHHRHPASRLDPDFHQGDRRFFAWYRHFMAGYLSVAQLGCLAAGWLLLWLLARSMTPTAFTNLLLFVVLPLLLSSLQLFSVGTYWPHRGPSWGTPEHCCRSLDWPEWLSLLACFHFGYHLEHHSNPQLAWFELPRLRQAQALVPMGQRGRGC